MKDPLSQASAEKLNEAIVRSNFDNLTPEILLEAFKAEGIGSLEDLAKRMTEALKDPRGGPERVPYSELFTQPTPKSIRDTITHPVPTVPFVVDGVMHDPEDIVRYNGEELGFIPQKGGTELLVMRDKGLWAPFVRTLLLTRSVVNGMSALEQYQFGGYSWVSPQDGPTVVVSPPPVTFGPPVPPPAPPWLSLWTDINLSGSALTLDPGESYRDLTNVGWWIFAGNWNDKFSSVHRTSSLCMAFEHIHFAGSFLWIGPSESHQMNLHDLGWGDRISSVINSG
jgi:hypothetical protein